MNSVISSDNPLGILAIDHLEFTCDDLSSTDIKNVFYNIGMTQTYECQQTASMLFSQGQVRFLLTANKDHESQSRQYFKQHGEGVSKISFIVENAQHAIDNALERGATLHSPLVTTTNENNLTKVACIKGFGDVINEFVERPMHQFRPAMKKIEHDPLARPLKSRVARIDHLTNNVPKGEMKKWVEFYQSIYGFKITRKFNIKGEKTGLFSEVVQLPNNAVIIPINEPSTNDGKSQIQEFIDLHRGAGVQHIALTCSNIIETVKELQSRDIRFLDIPSTYYEDIPKRGFPVNEDLGVLEDTQLLVDGDQKGYLIQNFTDTYIGPLFFEFIQRKKNDGFGEGNFQALFDSIERDQMKRGYL